MGMIEYMNGHSYIKECPATGHRISSPALHCPHQANRQTQGRAAGEKFLTRAFACSGRTGQAFSGNSNLPGSANQDGLIEYLSDCSNESKGPERKNKAGPERILSLVSMCLGLRRPAGFSLLECLISLSLSLLILVSALEVSVQARRVFVKLREAQEKDLGLAVALEKMREDLETAGAGIPRLLSGTGLSPIQLNGQTLAIFSADGKTRLLADISSGQTYLIVEVNAALSSILKKGRALYLTDGTCGELTYITSVSGNRLAVSPAINTAFEAARTDIIVLEKIELYLDRQQKILRRRVNNTTGQPLAEAIEGFTVSYQAEDNLASITLSIDSGGKVHVYELVMYPKNLSRL